jgi:Scramblase
MEVTDVTGSKDQKMMVLKRGYAFCGWAVCPCCIHSVSAHYVVDAAGQPINHTGSDTLIATIRVPWAGGCFTPTLNIEDRNGNYMGQVTGPCCCVTDCCGADFSIQDANGGKIGDIRKLGAGSLKDAVLELNTDADKFKISFPENLDPTMKMAILASLFQIDFSFFEDDRSPRECRCCDCYCCGWPMACFPKWMVCCCCYATKKEREAEEKKKKKEGAPQDEEMGR